MKRCPACKLDLSRNAFYVNSLLCANCNWIKRDELGELVGSRVYERKIPLTETVTL